jgi:hypothetical protein
MKLGCIVLISDKKQSMEWHELESYGTKKAKQSWSTFKVMLAVFWYCGGVILVDVMPGGETLSCDTYVRTLTDSGNFSNIFGHKNPT